MPSFQKIIDILSNAFSILDFSYIVSGGFTLGIVLFDLHYPVSYTHLTLPTNSRV